MEDNQALSHIKNLTVKEEVLYTKENQMDDAGIFRAGAGLAVMPARTLTERKSARLIR
jgi:hypothetical protein